FLCFDFPDSLIAMATACFGFFTTGPFLLPECSLPSLYSPITFFIFFSDFFIANSQSLVGFFHFLLLYLSALILAANMFLFLLLLIFHLETFASFALLPYQAYLDRIF